MCPHPEQLAEGGRRPEGVAQGLFVEIQGCGGDELAIDLREQERGAAGEPPAVERGQAFERTTVFVAAVPDQDWLQQVQLRRRAPARPPGQVGGQLTDKAEHCRSHLLCGRGTRLLWPVVPPCRVRERVPESIERMRALDRADEPLTGSRVADVEEHAVCRPVPEEGDLDPIALADRELVKRGGRLREHEQRVIRPHAPGQPVSANQRARCLDSLTGVASRTCRAVAAQAS